VGSTWRNIRRGHGIEVWEAVIHLHTYMRDGQGTFVVVFYYTRSFVKKGQCKIFENSKDVRPGSKSASSTSISPGLMVRGNGDENHDGMMIMAIDSD
jgi:hypothetical protein